MNLILINYSETLCPGGVNKVVMETAKNLVKRGHTVTILQNNPFNLPPEETVDNYKIIRIKSTMGKYLYDFSFEIYKFLKNNLASLNPDIIHVHEYTTLFCPEVIYTIRKLNPNIPLILSPHLDIFSHDTLAGKYLFKPYNQIIGKRLKNYVDLFISASYFEAGNIKKMLNVPEEKIKVIPHGINNIDLKKPDNNKKIIQLLYVGYLLELKGIQYIIEAVHELNHKKNIKTCLTIVGEGSYKNKLINLVDSLKLNKFIEFMGFINPKNQGKLSKLYKKADITLLLSKSENYGIVVIESLAMGTPVIVTDRTALSEFLTEKGCYGVKYPPDPEEVANLIINIYESKEKVGPLSDKIRTWEAITDQYEETYLELLNTISPQ